MILYQHLKPNGEVFYVGIGKDVSRAYKTFNRTTYWKNVITKYPNYEVQILKNDLTIQDARELESILISYYGRRDLGTGTLVNLTNGGEGTYGRIVSNEVREKHRNSMKGKRFTEEHKQKLSIIRKGKSLSENTKLKMKLSHLKNKNDITKIRKPNPSKKVIDIQTGIIYSSVYEICDLFNLNISTMYKKLSITCLSHINNTNFKYHVNDNDK